MPPLPKLGQGVKGGAGALPDMGTDNPLFSVNLGKSAPRIAPQPNTQPILPLSLPPEAPGLSQGPLTQIAQAQQAQRTTKVEDRAIKALADPSRLPKLDDAAKQVINVPTPRVVAAAQQLGFKALPHLVTKSDLGQMKVDFGTGKMSVGGKEVTPQDLAISGFQPHVSKVQQIVGGLAGQATGLGPGLAKLGIDAYHEVTGDIKSGLLGMAAGTPTATGGFHVPQVGPTGGPPAQHPLAADLQAMIDSYKESLPIIGHPGRQWQQDPTTLLENWATAPFLAAGGVARAAELPRAAELAAESGVSVPRQVARTLLRPRPQERAISAQFGENATPITLNPPAYKSALGGYAQRGLDWWLQHGLTNEPSDLTPQGVQKLVSTGRMSAANRFGRKLRSDLLTDINGRSGSLAAKQKVRDPQTGKMVTVQRMSDELAGSLARGTAHGELWDKLYGAGATADEVAAHGGEWTAIRPRPSDIPRIAPEYLTPKQIADHPSLSIGSEDALAREFTSKGRMIPTREEAIADEKSLNPQFKYVPKDLVNSLRTYERGTGSGAKALNAMDRGTQVIRSGRFMTPAYSKWAVQNGLIGAAQQGLAMPRNVFLLNKEFPKLSPKVQGALDGWMGKGIARSTAGGEAAVESRLGEATQGLRERWHVLDDQWARRMSAIHELYSMGYRDAKSWEKLYNKNPDKMRQIVRRGGKEAIDYSEMTPAERGTLQKVMTAYGWTRGATTYAGRFPLQHPVTAAVGVHAANQGEQYVNEFYNKLHGMVPSYLREDLPFMGHYLLGTSEFSPTGTAGNLLEEIPGATGSSTQALSSEDAPIPAMFQGWWTGRDPYGTQYKGNQRFTAPLMEAINKFKPLAAGEQAFAMKKGGTYVQGAKAAGLSALGIPVSELRNPKTTAGLGEKDFEQSLSTPDRIRFQYSRKLQNLPDELALYQKANGGTPIDSQSLSRLKADFDAVEQRDIFQYQYANSHGAKTWKSLPPLNKLAGTLDWMAHHGYNHAQIASIQHQAAGITDDKQVEQAVNTLWQNTGIGQVDSMWKSTVKGLQPPSLTKANP